MLWWAALAVALGAEPASGVGDTSPPTDDPCVSHDELGRPFAVCFNPGRGIELGTDVVARRGDTSSLSPGFSGAILYRTAKPSHTRPDSLWFNTHRFLDTHVALDPDARELTVTAYQGTLRRHVPEGFVLIPTPDPIRLRFPFDVALDVGALRYDRRVFEGPGYTLELAHAAVLFDPLRAEAGRERFAFGPALSDTVRVTPQAAVNEFSPLTSLQVDAGYETEDGWWVARFSALGGWTVVPGEQGRMRARANLSLDRVLIAINDQPVNLSLSAFGAWNDAGVSHRSEVGLSLGVVIRPLGREAPRAP